LRILILEDDPVLGAQLESALSDQGYAVDLSTDGEDGWYLGSSEPYAAIILDLGLPVMDGLSALKKWRAAGVTVPVIALTARNSWAEKVEGIDAGADDYLGKPFQMDELLARIRALIRRSAGHARSEFKIGEVMLDTRVQRVTVAGAPIKLTSLEYRVLAYLMLNKGKTVSRSELIEQLYSQDFDRDSNTVEVFIGRLRRKVGKDVIRTIRGLGYIADDPE
jgi:two-component system, OmpR family, response regulator